MLPRAQVSTLCHPARAPWLQRPAGAGCAPAQVRLPLHTHLGALSRCAPARGRSCCSLWSHRAPSETLPSHPGKHPAGAQENMDGRNGFKEGPELQVTFRNI